MENDPAARAALARGTGAIVLGFAASLLYLGWHGAGLLVAVGAVALIHLANRGIGGGAE